MYAKRLDSPKSTASPVKLLFLMISLLFAFGLADARGEEPSTFGLGVPLAEIFEPVRLYTPPTNGGVLLTEPDGRTVRFFYRYGEENVKTERYIGFVEEGASAVVYEDVSTDGGLTWQRGLKAFETPRTSHSDVAAVHSDTGEVYWLYRRQGKTYLIRTKDGRKDWSNHIEVPFATKFDSTSLIWLRDKEGSGHRRLVVATRSLTGKPGSETWVSDDDGVTWQGPSNICNCPRHPDRWGDVGSSAHLVELRDGRLWMLLRNAQDHLWEYFSDDRGLSWGKGRSSRFTGVFSNVRLVRLADGRLVICWLNAMPMSGQRKQWNAHKTARDALNVAISDDDGETWRGFREVVLSTQRHERIYAPVKATDASVHHQKITFTRDGKAIVFTGQDNPRVAGDSPHRQAVIFDLDWLYETSRSTDFSEGYANLSTQKFSKEPWPGTYDYSRTHGATVIEHPTKTFGRVLHLGREKCDWVLNEQDGANWSFPIGKRGTLETRILLRKGFKGGSISLTDVFYPPSDNAGDQAVMYELDIPPDGRIGSSTVLNTDTWYNIKLEWTGTDDKATHFCRVSVNDALLPGTLPLTNSSRNGLCYVRLRSTAPEEDLAGWLVAGIKARIDWNE